MTMTQNEFLQHIGNNIRKFRQARGLSLTILGDKIGIPARAVEEIEQGLIATSVADLYDIASILEVDPKELFV